MDISQDKEFNKSYTKCKMTVKKWEKEFVKLNGRIPSKHDIKEASSQVRHAYKYYFNLKSAVLETSLMDIPLGSDEDLDDLFSSTSIESALKTSEPTEDKIRALPTPEQIGKLMNKTKDDTDNKFPRSGVWGSHLNNKKSIDDKPLRKSPRKGMRISQELFKSCSFNKRNPRKSLSFQKSDTPIEVDKNSQIHQNSQIETAKTNINDEENLKADEVSPSYVKVNKDVPHQSVNPVQFVMSQPNFSSSRNINSGWLNRCGFNTSCDDVTLPDCKEEKESILSQLDQSTRISNTVPAYGLKNLSVCPIIPTIGDSYHSDIVENSESETEKTSNKAKIYKKIRPIVKKQKIQESSEEVVNIKNTSPAQEEKSKTDDIPIKKRKKRGNQKLASDSEYEEEVIKKRPVRKVAKKSKQALKKDKNKMNEVSNVNEFEHELINVSVVSMPRFGINSSVLKEHNVIDGLAAALVIPGNEKRTKGKSRGKSMTDKEKLQKKVEDGSLNENFIKINIEKKVFVRGKKTINFSKYKKQLYKNKKKVLHDTPEFPDGGVLKCFKCGQAGHMARYCRAHKGEELLALEHVDDPSSIQTLQEAEMSTDVIDKLTVSDKLLFQSILEEGEITENTGDVTVKGVHAISESFLKLLAGPLKTTDSIELSIDPLYSLSPRGDLMDTPEGVKEALKMFGHSDFRGGQERAIMRILSGLSTLVTLSTGSGKSLCYQLPAYLYAKHNKCITLVISPLVSLMEDQVTNMPSFVRAACLHTNQSPTTRAKIIELIKSGEVHILLISPEAIVSGEKSSGFGGIMKFLPPIAFACIDEVHCVSQWSHNFRPSYLMICRVLREKMGVKCVLGLTATATKPTILNIVKHLEIRDGIEGVITNLPLPNNLILTVSSDSRRDDVLIELLQSQRFAECNSIIVYCIRRDECERVARLIRATMRDTATHLTKKSISEKKNKRKRCESVVESYHAGMSGAKRRRVQEAFMSGDLRIVVATVAFGMGIDKSDIRGVVHYNMPSCFESYVQEVGRAGRDGLPAQCHVFIDHEFRDKDELLRHIHANSIERHVIRKLLKKVFIPCGCSSIIKKNTDSEDRDDRQNESRCQGHEVAFPVDETVTELDIPSENIATLLCYLELHPKKYAKVLSHVYKVCKICSYGGPSAILRAAEKCAPLAMALALQKKKGVNINGLSTVEFCVIEVAAAIGWDSGVVKYHLKNLEWDKTDRGSKKSLLRVEFNTLGFRIKSPGDLSSQELDSALDSIYERTQLQERTMLHQLQEVSKALISVSFPNIYACSTIESDVNCVKKSNELKVMIRDYFLRDSQTLGDMKLDERPVNKEHVVSEVRGLLATYRDCTFSGRAVARILQGISSPNFPAIVWGRCRYWRSQLTADFYKLTEIATQQIISMR